MDAGGLSLGDILATVFAAVDAQPCVDRFEGETARALCTAIAENYGVEWSDAWDALCSVPDEALGGLKTASGWTALAALAANQLRVSGDPLIPNVH